MQVVVVDDRVGPVEHRVRDAFLRRSQVVRCADAIHRVLDDLHHRHLGQRRPLVVVRVRRVDVAAETGHLMADLVQQAQLVVFLNGVRESQDDAPHRSTATKPPGPASGPLKVTL